MVTIASLSGDGPDTFAQSGLDALLSTAAQDCPDAVLVRDDAGPSTAADLDRRSRALAWQFHATGLTRGERVLIVTGAQADALVAIIACLRAGLEPALVPCGLGAIEFAAHASVADARALVGPSRYGSLALGDEYLSAAALASSIRMIATHGPEPVDGALDISPASLDTIVRTGEARAEGGHEPPPILTFQGPPGKPLAIAHRQAALLADGLSLVEQARINPSKRIISTLPPATRAGLVAGPFAAFIGASCLVLHGPFEAARFLAACDAEPGFHLVAPAGIGAAFSERSFAEGVASLILVSRYASQGAFALPPPIASERPIVDLYAFAEESLLAQRRVDGEARPPTRITDKSISGGLGARLNRARDDLGAQGAERP